MLRQRIKKTKLDGREIYIPDPDGEIELSLSLDQKRFVNVGWENFLRVQEFLRRKISQK